MTRLIERLVTWDRQRHVNHTKCWIKCGGFARKMEREWEADNG